MDHLTILQGDDCIRIGQRLGAVGDEQHGMGGGKAAGGFPDAGFVVRVKVAGRLVQDDQPTRFEEGAGKRQALRLPGG